MKEGYKKTDVGVIPEEWEVKRINELLIESYLGGNYKNTLEKNFEKNTLPLIKMGNIGRGKICTDTYYSIETKEELNEKHLLYFNDILFNTRNTLDLVGKVAIWKSEYDKAYFNSNLLKLVFDKSKIISSDFINYQLNSYNTLRKLKAVATGTTSVAAIYDKDLKKIQLPIPPLPEQKTIANCLTTWDSGIEKLSALIKAKKEQKKGLMQQLLTGEKRLDGFEEEWREITLGDIGVFKTSSVNKKIEENETKVWLLNYMDVYRNTHISSKIKFQLTSAKQSQISSTNLKVGDVLFTPSSETPDDIGHSAVVIENLENVVYSYHLVRFRVKKNILDINFSGYVFNKSEILNEFSRRATGSTRYTLSVKDFNEVTTFLPPLKEQSKIAEVLTTADKEITLLEKKFERFKEQKRGLMQVLLTGERRLITQKT